MASLRQLRLSERGLAPCSRGLHGWGTAHGTVRHRRRPAMALVTLALVLVLSSLVSHLSSAAAAPEEEPAVVTLREFLQTTTASERQGVSWGQFIASTQARGAHATSGAASGSSRKPPAASKARSGRQRTSDAEDVVLSPIHGGVQDITGIAELQRWEKNPQHVPTRSNSAALRREAAWGEESRGDSSSSRSESSSTSSSSRTSETYREVNEDEPDDSSLGAGAFHSHNGLEASSSSSSNSAHDAASDSSSSVAAPPSAAWAQTRRQGRYVVVALHSVNGSAPDGGGPSTTVDAVGNSMSSNAHRGNDNHKAGENQTPAYALATARGQPRPLLREALTEALADLIAATDSASSASSPESQATTPTTLHSRRSVTDSTSSRSQPATGDSSPASAHVESTNSISHEGVRNDSNSSETYPHAMDSEPEEEGSDGPLSTDATSDHSDSGWASNIDALSSSGGSSSSSTHTEERQPTLPFPTVTATSSEPDPGAPEMYRIDSDHMLVYVPAVTGAVVREVISRGGEWTVYDVFQSSAGQQLKMAPGLRSLVDATNLTACGQCLRGSVMRGTGRTCEASAGAEQDQSTQSTGGGICNEEDDFPSSPLRLQVLVANGEAAQVVTDFVEGSRIADLETAANLAASGREETAGKVGDSVVSDRDAHNSSSADISTSSKGDASLDDVSGDAVSPAGGECKTFFRVADRGTILVDLHFRDCMPSALTAGALRGQGVNATTGGGCECLRILSAIAAHPSVRWMESRATRAEMQNYKAAATLQSGCDADVLEGAPDGAASPEDQAARFALAHPVWSMGIDGTGEVVAVADSGLDYRSCFFVDPGQQIAVFPAVNYAHRKIVSLYTCSSGSSPIAGSSGGSGDTSPAPSGVSLDGTTMFLADDVIGDRASGHGTHVAGSAVGSPYRSADRAEVNSSTFAECEANTGVAPGAKLFFRILGCASSVDPLPNTGNGAAAATTKADDLPLPRDITDIFAPAYAAQARISSNSWGFPSETSGVYSAIERRVDRFAYMHDDMLILLAAGNSPKNGLYSPGAAKNVLTVGAHENSFAKQKLDTVAFFSAHGPTYDQRRKPEVLGPGGGAGVWSADASGAANVSQCGVTAKRGTSMATALLAGAGALTRQFARERLKLASPSSALLKAMLVHATVRLPPSVPFDSSGFGRVDLSLVLGEVVAPASGDLSPAHQTIVTRHHDNRAWVQDRLVIHDRETHMYCFSATAADAGAPSPAGGDGAASVNETESRTLKVTLAWNDPATALEGSATSLVHDLDVVVVDAVGTVYYAHPTDPTKVYLDRRNNVEMVRVPNVTHALAQLFRVYVYGNSVQETANGQAYSLVVSAPGLVIKDDCLDAIHKANGLAAAQQQQQQQLEGDKLLLGGGAGPSSAVVVHCPGNCTGNHGFCNTGTAECMCATGFRFVDCSLCDEDVVCHRHGTCDTKTLTCSCRPGSHFQDPHCSVCERGWFGPLCDSQCVCENGGVCDRDTGACACPKDYNVGGTGCYQGSRCQFCCEGLGGVDCNERSFWCDEKENAVALVDDADGGYIQVNGYGSYPYSATCRWNITALPYHRVQLEYISYDIETPYDALFLFDFARTAASSSSSSQALESADGGNQQQPSSDAFLVRKDAGVLLEADSFVVESTNRSFFLLFLSDWAEVREGFLLRYSFLPTSRCTRTCTSPFPEVASQALTCGEAIGLLERCVCARPYVGWYCNITGLSPSTDAPPTPAPPSRDLLSMPANAAATHAPGAATPVTTTGPTSTRARRTDNQGLHTKKSNIETISLFGTGGSVGVYTSKSEEDDGKGTGRGTLPPTMVVVNPRDALRPQNPYFVSESVLTLGQLPMPTSEGTRGEDDNDASTAIEVQSIARVPLVINGYTLLTVQSAYNESSMPPVTGTSSTTGDAAREWVVDLLLVPFSGTDAWMTELRGLKLGVRYVNRLRPNILSSNMSEMQMIDLFECPDSPTPTFRAPLRVPPNMVAPGGTSRVQLEAKLLLTLLWDPTEPVPLEMQAHTYLDTAVLAIFANYTSVIPTQPSSGSGGSSSSSGTFFAGLRLQCRDLTVKVVVGAGYRVTEPTALFERYVQDSALSFYHFIVAVLGCGALGGAGGVWTVRRQLRLARGTAGGAERPMLGSAPSTTASGNSPSPTSGAASSFNVTGSSNNSSGSSTRQSDDDEERGGLRHLGRGDDSAAGHLRRGSYLRGATQVVARSRNGPRGMFRSYGGGAVARPAPSPVPAPGGTSGSGGALGEGASTNGWPNRLDTASPSPARDGGSYLSLISTAGAAGTHGVEAASSGPVRGSGLSNLYTRGRGRGAAREVVIEDATEMTAFAQEASGDASCDYVAIRAAAPPPPVATTQTQPRQREGSRGAGDRNALDELFHDEPAATKKGR